MDGETRDPGIVMEHTGLQQQRLDREAWRILICMALLAVFSSAARGQGVEWIRQFGTPDQDVGAGVAVDTSGSIYVVGNVMGPIPLPGQMQTGAHDAFLRKFASTGSVVWTRQFGLVDADNGGEKVVYGNGVTTGSDGSVYVAGETSGVFPGQTSAGRTDAFVRKYDQDGVEIWTRQVGSHRNDIARSAAADAAGSCYFAGRTSGAMPGQTRVGGDDAFVGKYDADGNLEWLHQFGTAVSDRADVAAVDPDGNVLVAGVFEQSGGKGDVFLHKYDPDGGEIWTRRFGTTGGWPFGLTVDTAGNPYVVGVVNDTLPGQTKTGLEDAFVRKYDPDGGEIWTRQFGAGEATAAHGVSVDGSGRVWIGGATNGTFPDQSSEGRFDVFVRVHDTSGDELWTCQFGGPEDDRPQGMSGGPDGSVYPAGITRGALRGQTFEGVQDAFVLKFLQGCGATPSANAVPSRVCRGGEALLDASATATTQVCISAIEYAWTETPNPPPPPATCGPGQILDCWDETNVTLELTDLSPPAGEDTVTRYLWVRPRGEPDCANEEPYPVSVEVDSTVPDSELEVFVTKTRPEGLRVTWTGVPDGDSYRVARGDLGAWYSHATDDAAGQGVCDTNGNLSWEDPTGQTRPGSFYYLAVPLSACKFEGPWGAASDGTLRPERISTPACP